MLMAMDYNNQDSCTREQLKSFLISSMKMDSLIERDLDIFMRTHEMLADRPVFHRTTLKAIFD
jgi:hypothetical protein